MIKSSLDTPFSIPNSFAISSPTELISSKQGKSLCYVVTFRKGLQFDMLFNFISHFHRNTVPISQKNWHFKNSNQCPPSKKQPFGYFSPYVSRELQSLLFLSCIFFFNFPLQASGQMLAPLRNLKLRITCASVPLLSVLVKWLFLKGRHRADLYIPLTHLCSTTTSLLGYPLQIYFWVAEKLITTNLNIPDQIILCSA